MNYGHQQQYVQQPGYVQPQVHVQPVMVQPAYVQPAYVQPVAVQPVAYTNPQPVAYTQPGYTQQPASRPYHNPNQNYEQPRPKNNQIAPVQPKAKNEESRVNFGGDSSSSDSDVRFVRGKSYCCGLINTGDSICMNCCKFIIVFVICPLAIYWMWSEGHIEKILEKAGSTLSGGCGCCKKYCGMVSGKLNGSCVQKLCNGDKCKSCCGLQRFFEGICSCFKQCCKKGCLTKVCGFIGKLISCRGLKECCGPCCGCIKKGLKCGNIGALCKGCCKCDFDKLDCCDPQKGCKNMFQCCGDCPCCKKCANFDTCSCCNRAGATAKNGIKEVGGCCTQVKQRCCNCCFLFKKKAASKGASLSKNFGRGRYKPKSKFFYLKIFFRTRRMLLLFRLLQEEDKRCYWRRFKA